MSNPYSDERILQNWDLQTHQNTAWTSMSVPEINEFLLWHPTYMMSVKEASDWWGNVNDAIKRDKEKWTQRPQADEEQRMADMMGLGYSYYVKYGKGSK